MLTIKKEPGCGQAPRAINGNIRSKNMLMALPDQNILS